MNDSERPSRHENLMEMAWVISKRSTCSRLNVGAIFARDGRVLMAGYNGAPSGLPHCNHVCSCPSYEKTGFHDPICRVLQPCSHAEHAERNGIAFAARYGVALNNSILYVTHSPCLVCSYIIVGAGVTEVYYDIKYRLSEGLEFLEASKIPTHQIETRGITE